MDFAHYIGGGWVARLIQNGVDVGIFDPDPEAPRKIAEVMANAEHAVGQLTMAPLPAPGKMVFAGSVSRKEDWLRREDAPACNPPSGSTRAQER